MKLLLINPMASRKAPVKGRPSHFPVGIGLISSYLKQHGHEVEILDNETECLNRDELAKFIEASDHDVYGITAMSPQYSYIKGVSRLIKRLRNKPVILGGPLATYSFKTVLENTGVDVCVLGEGEETMADLLGRLDSLADVDGIAYLDNGNVMKTSSRNYQKSRDEYPFPDYESFNMQPYFAKTLIQYESGLAASYFNPVKSTARLKTIGLITGMGCPYQCAYCSKSVGKTRLRSIANIVEEIKFLSNSYGVDGIFFLDDLLLFNRSRTLELCDQIKPFNLVWSGQARANVLTDEIASAMKASGCIGVGLGLESGSDRMLKAMNKEATVEQNEKAIKAALKNDLIVRAQLLYGFPGENKESVDQTIELFKKTGLSPRRFNILTPLPGSLLFMESLKKGLISDEAKYLEEVSKYEAGFASKKILLNLTEMSDDEFISLLNQAETAMIDNFKKMIKSKHKLWRLKVFYLKILRLLLRLSKVASIRVWKRKLRQLLNNDQAMNLTSEETENLYFQFK